MALFKIFKGSDSSKITDSSVSGYKIPVDGYAYYDTSTNLFYIDADYEGHGTITREPINAHHADSATAATLAYAAENDTEGNSIINTYAAIDSPGLIGIPTAPTAASGTNTTQIATTAFVQDATSNLVQIVTWGSVVSN